MTKQARLNARLDPELARKVAYIRSRTQGTTTEVIRRSIDHYYEVLRAEPNPALILAEVGFTGSAEGSKDLSKTYKSDLAQLLSRKA